MGTGCAVLGWFKSVKASTRRFLDDVAIRRSLRQELTSLGGDLDRVLAEIGITRNEMERLIQNAPRARPLLQSMTRRLGLEQRLAHLAPDLMRTVERRCATCNYQAECEDWIAHAQASDGYPRFCPNAETFGSLSRTGKAA